MALRENGSARVAQPQLVAPRELDLEYPLQCDLKVPRLDRDLLVVKPLSGISKESPSTLLISTHLSPLKLSTLIYFAYLHLKALPSDELVSRPGRDPGHKAGCKWSLKP